MEHGKNSSATGKPPMKGYAVFTGEVHGTHESASSPEPDTNADSCAAVDTTGNVPAEGAVRMSSVPYERTNSRIDDKQEHNNGDSPVNSNISGATAQAASRESAHRESITKS